MSPLRFLSLAAMLGLSLRATIAQAEEGIVDTQSEDTDGARARAALDEGYERKAKGELEGAARAFEAARAAGAEPQLVALELGYLAATRGDSKQARGYFQEASLGDDATLRSHAAKELDALGPDIPIESGAAKGKGPTTLPPLAYMAAVNEERANERRALKNWWGDLYAEAYGWHRVAGASLEDDLVPTLRLRALYRLTERTELDVYGVAKATRDLASRGRNRQGVPIIYADNHATLGAGAMLRVWRRQLGFFAQAGPTLNLVDTGGQRLDFDVRAGAFLGMETSRCAMRSRESAFVHWPCAELYSEAVYVNRFDDNVIAFGRGRAGMTYWATGPLLSQLLLEARAGLDTNDDYYNNFTDFGAVHRFRFVEPLRLDVMTGIHGGSYLGRAGRDPAPSPLHYVELRLQAATYLEF